MTQTNLTSRHDLDQTTRQAIKKAVALDLIDAVDAAVMGALLENNNIAWLEMLCDIAFAARHTPAGREAHKAMCEANDYYHASRR